ncbi:hypothetical protein D3C85_1173350 [compost metagenome]
MAYLEQRKQLVRLVFKIYSQSSSVVSKISFDCEVPALFTSKSKAPKFSLTKENNAATSFSELTSAALKNTLVLNDFRSSKVSLKASLSSLSFKMISAPFSAKTSAIPLPIPLAAPVIKAIFPFNSLINKNLYHL